MFLKYQQLVKNRHFSYKELFFGHLSWYQNSRNWVLILAILICELTLKLKSIYLLLALTGLLLLLISGLNWHFKIQRSIITLSVFFLGALMMFGSGWILYQL
ncbi:hypothetical protein [Liquorilactobacillus sicerae]|uniref:hypothetical protein n=1 Tax=Liquorilactobacillus sicerae TaxID=1416943 RepID=UPI00247FAA2B|nr:hypothetical protein [Liquorilactobacillus sicerae]